MEFIKFSEELLIYDEKELNLLNKRYKFFGGFNAKCDSFVSLIVETLHSQKTFQNCTLRALKLERFNKL